MAPKKAENDVTLEQMQQQLGRISILEEGMSRMDSIEQKMDTMQ